MDSLPPGVDLCAIPAGTPPDGVTSNLVNPPTLAPATITICTVLTAWAVSFTIGRLFVNRRRLKLADFFMVIGAILSVTYTGLIISLYPYNRHIWDVPVCWFDVRQLQIIFAHTTIVGAVLFFPKCAILFMYRNIFEIRPWLNVAVWTGVAFSFAIYFPSIPLSAIYSAPRAGHSWAEMLLVTDHKPLIIWGVVQGSCSVVLDIYIFVLPIPLLSNLRLPFKKKAQLIVLFGTALLGVAASVTALVYRIRFLYATDATWEQASLAMCVVAENNVAIITGSMPAFASFMRLYVASSPSLQSLLSRFRGGTKYGSYGSQGERPSVQAGGTFGSPMKPVNRSNPYYELSDSMLIRTEVDASGEEALRHGNAKGLEETGIVRTIGFSQRSRSGSESCSVDQGV